MDPNQPQDSRHGHLREAASLDKLKNLQFHFSHIAPHLTTHLTDREANPILSTHPEPASEPLVSLSDAFVSAYETASRMGLGSPLRITLSTAETNLVVIQSAPSTIQRVSIANGAVSGFPDPCLTTTKSTGDADSNPKHTKDEDSSNLPDSSRMFVGTVVGPSRELAEARVAIWGVEDVARGLNSGLRK
ncbi:hypothetical protein ABW19_dt0203901 [Dactylella cylindrospora]|nr:hypothetical protein ABW19_dt0203901 [Dactylella cylindrospora]